MDDFTFLEMFRRQTSESVIAVLGVSCLKFGRNYPLFGGLRRPDVEMKESEISGQKVAFTRTQQGR